MTAPTETVLEIDDLSVIQVVHDGMRLHLKARERDEAIKRMHRRLDPAIIAWRLYITPRTVQRVAARLGLTQPAAEPQPPARPCERTTPP
jgi:hypothetical protein